MTLEDHLADATHRAQLENARLINRFRLAGVAAFAITAMVVVYLGNDLWTTLAKGLGIYFFIALLLWALSERHSRILWLSRFGIPVIDILISETTAAALPDELKLTEVGEFPIRGRTEPLKLYTPAAAEQNP